MPRMPFRGHGRACFCVPCALAPRIRHPPFTYCHCRLRRAFAHGDVDVDVAVTAVVTVTATVAAISYTSSVVGVSRICYTTIGPGPMVCYRYKEVEGMVLHLLQILMAHSVMRRTGENVAPKPADAVFH